MLVGRKLDEDLWRGVKGGCGEWACWFESVKEVLVWV